MLHISGLRGEETCYISVVSEERKHATYQWSLWRGFFHMQANQKFFCPLPAILEDKLE